jgi:hypothetical protein
VSKIVRSVKNQNKFLLNAFLALHFASVSIRSEKLGKTFDTNRWEKWNSICRCKIRNDRLKGHPKCHYIRHLGILNWKHAPNMARGLRSYPHIQCPIPHPNLTRNLSHHFHPQVIKYFTEITRTETSFDGHHQPDLSEISIDITSKNDPPLEKLFYFGRVAL